MIRRNRTRSVLTFAGVAMATLVFTAAFANLANGAVITLQEIYNGTNGVAGGGDDLTGTLSFLDVSTDGTLVAIAGTGTGGINAGSSSGNNWGRADASFNANGTTFAGNAGGRGSNILEGQSVNNPDLKWSVTLTPDTTYNMHLHYLTHSTNNQNWGGEFGIAHSGTGGSITSPITFDDDSPGSIFVTNTGNLNVTYRRLAAGTVTTDGSGNADLFISRGSGSVGGLVGLRTMFDGVVFEPVVTAAVPEPSTFALAALGLLGLAWYDRRRKRTA